MLLFSALDLDIVNYMALSSPDKDHNLKWYFNVHRDDLWTLVEVRDELSSVKHG